MTTAQVLLDGPVVVAYGQLYLKTEDADPPSAEFAFQGQRNGLCGAATPGCLYLVTGLRNGTVGFAVELRTDEPDDGRWEEIVEASFTHAAGDLLLTGPDGDAYEIALPAGHYRVRYCATGMQAGYDAESHHDEPPLDRYRLTLWPSGTGEADRIVRQSSEIAAYWHRENAAPGGVTEQVDFDDRTTGPLARQPAELQRRVARWAALSALAVAGLDGTPAVAPAVARLRAGEPVPSPFDDELAVMMEVFDEVGRTTVPPLNPAEWESDELPVREWSALLAVTATADPDPLKAAADALDQAATAFGGDDIGTFLAALREAFPQIVPWPSGS